MNIPKLIDTLERQSRGWGTFWEKRQASGKAYELLRSLFSTQVRHVKRGSTYDVLGEAEVQISTLGPNGQFYDVGARLLREGDKLVVYRGEDGKLWIRFPDEFEDGRFEPL